MKKFALCILTLFVTLFGFASMTVHAGILREDTLLSGTQQTAEAVTATVTSYFDESNHPSQTVSSTYGTKLSVTNKLSDYTGYSFYCWIVNGDVRTDLAIDYQFTMTIGLDLVAIFHPNGTNETTLKYAVVFMDANEQMLKVEYVLPNGAATAPSSLPTKLGYEVSATPWSNDFSDVTGNLVTVLQYTKTNASSYTLTVVNGTGGGSVDYNAVATVVADAAPDGQVFHHWEMQDQTVSYSSTYSFTMVENTTVTAYYSTSAPADQPRVFLTNDLALRTSYKTFIGQFYLPSGYTLVEWGVASTATATAMVDIGTASVIRNKSTKYNAATNEFVVSIATGNAASYRGYLVCKNASEELVTVYSENAYNVVNGGFETGDLTGWNVSQIWKNESGMAAFSSSLVTTSTYFSGSYPYGRDGSYNMGVTSSGTTNWDQNDERMGYLRSSDFVLGGSGWVSFKIGGAKTQTVTYVSVRKTSDNTEIARFGNPNFNNTTIATAQYGSSISNAEAFLFQYYYDLSSVGTIGETYYFVFCDTAAYDWSILSIDSLVTYYAVAPTPGSNQTATNIVPSINTTDADNTIKNGYFDTDLSYWTAVDSNWYYSSNHYAKSNYSGDSGLGVIRSSAFYVTTNKYIRFDWAGGLSYDKRIYISIKEVGTNIEVLRYVRRDNLSSKQSESFDNHMLDLSSLSSSKMYYIEFVDNCSGSWGISYVDSIRFVTESEWNSVTSTDRAVSITPLETSFVYVKPF
jgi:hypothetical protein